MEQQSPSWESSMPILPTLVVWNSSLQNRAMLVMAWSHKAENSEALPRQTSIVMAFQYYQREHR
jgi:hypothetical protein